MSAVAQLRIGEPVQIIYAFFCCQRWPSKFSVFVLQVPAEASIHEAYYFSASRTASSHDFVWRSPPSRIHILVSSETAVGEIEVGDSHS